MKDVKTATLILNPERHYFGSKKIRFCGKIFNSKRIRLGLTKVNTLNKSLQKKGDLMEFSITDTI